MATFTTIAGWVTLALGVVVIAWALLADRARGRLRCARCFYDLGSIAARAPAPTREAPIVCPECGRQHHHPAQLRRTRKRWRGVLVGLLWTLAAYALFVTPAVRQRGWAAAVPTWVYVLGPVEVVGSIKQGWTSIKVSSGWPWKAMRDEEWRRAYDARAHAGVAYRVWQRVRVWRIERAFVSQGRFWDSAKHTQQPATEDWAVRCVDLGDMMEADPQWADWKDGQRMQWTSPTNPPSPTNWAEWKLQWTWSFGDTMRDAVAMVIGTKNLPAAQFPGDLHTDHEGQHLIVGGTPMQLEAFDAIVATSKRILEMRRGGQRPSLIVAHGVDCDVVVRSMDDLTWRTLYDVHQLSSEDSDRWLMDLHEKVATLHPGPERNGEAWPNGWFVEHPGRLLVYSLQTPAQRAAMDAELEALRSKQR